MVRSDTSSPSTALKRLCEALGNRGITIALERRKGARGRSIVLRREGRRRVIVFAPHPARRNVEVLESVALASKRCGGAGMTRIDLVREVAFDDLSIRVPLKPRRRRATVAAEEVAS